MLFADFKLVFLFFCFKILNLYTKIHFSLNFFLFKNVLNYLLYLFHTARRGSSRSWCRRQTCRGSAPHTWSCTRSQRRSGRLARPLWPRGGSAAAAARPGHAADLWQGHASPPASSFASAPRQAEFRCWSLQIKICILFLAVLQINELYVLLNV